MEIFKITVKVPKPVEEVFTYITTPENLPKWKKDVWTTGRKSGQMGPGFKMIQTVYLMSPRKFTMHVTGYEQNRYFKFEALTGFAVLPGCSFSFEPTAEGTLLTATSELNVTGNSIRGMLYPMGLYWHWKAYFQLLSRQLFASNSMIETVSFSKCGADLPDDEVQTSSD